MRNHPADRPWIEGLGGWIAASDEDAAVTLRFLSYVSKGCRKDPAINLAHEVIHAR
jgi:hypothetical protein